MRITIISFSNRENGNSQSIAKLAAEAYAGNEVKVFFFSDFALTSCGKCDNQCFHNRTSCPYISDMTYEIYDSIANSDLAVFVVQNYCGYPCSNFFVLNERSLCYFGGRQDLLDKYENVQKKFIAVSNSEADNMAAAFSYQTYATPDILYLASKTYGKKSLAGDLMESEEARKDVLDFLRLYS